MASDTRVWDAIRRTVSEMGRASVRVGVVGDEARKPHGNSGVDNAEIALWMEYGTKHLPERSFIRSTLVDPTVQRGLVALEATLMREVIAGRLSRDAALEQIGAFMAARIKERILNHEIRPEDAPSTVAAKGHDTVLVETHQLVNAVGFEVVK